MTDRNPDLARAVDRLSDPRRLVLCAHEIGHGLGQIAEGIRPKSIRLKSGFFGFTGSCEWGQMPEPSWSRERRKAFLVTLIAGHAAEVRFCRLYLGMDHRQAVRYGRDYVDGDYRDFRYWRGQLGLGWNGLSPEWAFDHATRLLTPQGRRLDQLTLRLNHTRHLPGNEL